MGDEDNPEKTTPAQKRPRVGAVEDGEILAGRYRLVRFVASGGMGEVWEAEDLSLHELVALKTIRPETMSADSLERFRSEVKLARRVAHRNVCRVFEFGEHVRATGGPPVTFLTMELLRGLPLDEVIRRRGKLPFAEALPLLQQMAAALDAAHQEGIVHRDFKSPNVFLEDQAGAARVAVTDFGLARALGNDVRLTQDKQQMMGTPGYMAPEQVHGRDAGPAADIWALGVVAFELVTGELPFTGDSALAVALKRLTEPPRSARALVPDLPPQWEQALAVALARKPEHRYPTARAFVEALQSSPRSSRARSWALPLIAMGLALLSVVAWRLLALERGAPATSPSPPPEKSPAAGLQPTLEKKWVIDVPVSPDELVIPPDGGLPLGLAVVVTRTGFLVGASGAILPGIPNDADGTMDLKALRLTLRRAKAAWPHETQLVVFCETGVDRRACDLARISAAEDEGSPIFPDQYLVEGAVPAQLLVGGGSGFEVRFTTDAMMPVRRLSADALSHLKAKYRLDPLLRQCPDQTGNGCDQKTHKRWCDDEDRFLACCGNGLVAVGHDGLCACPPGGADPDASVPGCLAAKLKARDWVAQNMLAVVPAMRHCYEARLGKNAALRGRVVVHFELAPDGRLFDVRQLSAELADSDVQVCVLEAIRKARFQAPPGGALAVTYPLVFTQQR